MQPLISVIIPYIKSKNIFQNVLTVYCHKHIRSWKSYWWMMVHRTNVVLFVKNMQKKMLVF